MTYADADLLLDYLDMRLSPDETTEIERRLRSEPALADLLLELATDEIVIREWAGAQKTTPLASGSTERPARGSRYQLRSIPTAAAALAIVAVFAWLFAANDSQSTRRTVAGVVKMSGTVTWTRSGAAPQAATASDDLPAGASIQVGSQSSATIRLTDRTLLHLHENTEFDLPVDVVSDDVASTTVRCQLGRVVAEVTPQPAGRLFVLQTPQATVEVLGTRFTVDVGAVRTRVDLHEGRVRLVGSTDQRSLELQPDEFAVIAPDQPLVVHSTDATHEPVVLLSVADTFTNSNHPDENFGTQPHLAVGESWTSFLKFDIPPDAPRGRAELVLHALHGGHNLHVLFAESDWSESDVAHHRHPETIDADVRIPPIRGVHRGRPLTIDVTEAIQRPGPITFALRSHARPGIEFASREASGHEPRLRLLPANAERHDHARDTDDQGHSDNSRPHGDMK